MIQRRGWIIGATFLFFITPLARPAIGAEHSAPTATKSARKTTKPHAKAAKPAAKAARKPGPPRPSDLAKTHRPPTPAPTPVRSHFDVPQAKTLADTPDVVLNSKVRASLISVLPGAAGQDIMSDTSKGVVTLTGSVKTPQLRARAEQVAKKVHGVRAVKNHLAVK